MHDDENYRYIGRGKVIDLSVYENEVLKELIANKGKVVKYETILLKLYEVNDIRILYHALTTIICRLRKKLKGEVEIKTKNKVGFYI